MPSLKQTKNHLFASFFLITWGLLEFFPVNESVSVLVKQIEGGLELPERVVEDFAGQHVQELEKLNGAVAIYVNLLSKNYVIVNVLSYVLRQSYVIFSVFGDV